MTRLLIPLAILAMAGCAPPEAPPPADSPPFHNARAGVAFVGDDACFDCHEDQYRGFKEHGMARSLYLLTPETAVEDFSADAVYHEGSGFYYRAFQEGDRYFQEEFRQASSHRLVREMKYVVGSGTAARTYLTEENGRLYELPLTWYTQKEKWDFSPGYREQNSRFTRLIPDRCMACHNSYPRSTPFAEGKYDAVPLGIGCERCHGPGALHVEARLAAPAVEGAVDSTIVNPAHLSLDLRLDVCQQCHLNTTVSVLREGRGAYDFRPSQPLDAHVSMFVAESAGGDDAVRVISHADRMKRSACFIETRQAPRPMDCVTCHDPHRGFRDLGPVYFNNSCQGCHQPAALQVRLPAEARPDHSASANCISCHMPKVEAEDAPHSDFTDHLIRVVGQTVAPPALAEGDADLTPYFERDRTGSEGRRYEGIAYVVYGRQNGDSTALRRGIRVLEDALRQDPDHSQAQFLLGIAHLQLGQFQAAIPPLEASVRLDAGVPERLNALAQAYEADRRSPQPIRRLYERALAIQPALADIRLNYGRYLEASGELDLALAQYEAAIEEHPWQEAAHYNLGTLHLRMGEFEAGEGALLRALELRPDYPEALGNLGLMHASRGEPERARGFFERAVEAAPENPVALGNLGAFHLNQDDLDVALRLLERAVTIDPAYVDGRANLALAYFRDEQFGAAQLHAREALRLRPENPVARQILEAL